MSETFKEIEAKALAALEAIRCGYCHGEGELQSREVLTYPEGLVAHNRRRDCGSCGGTGLRTDAKPPPPITVVP